VKGDLKASFGKVLKGLREQKGLSQQELADYSEVDRTYISDLERGLHYPTLNVVFKLSEILEIKPHEFIQKVDKQLFIG
jgi:transcriptional regulator with XRE-family HTH domain